MATDYDAPRKTDEELNEDSIEELKTRRNDKNSGKVDEDETEAAEAFELPGADLSHEELTVRVLPRQSDEFTCAGCFLVRHRSQIAEERKNGDAYCFDCAGIARTRSGPTTLLPVRAEGRLAWLGVWTTSERPTTPSVAPQSRRQAPSQRDRARPGTEGPPVR